MNLRLLELIAPPDTAREAREVIKDENIVGIWTENIDNGCAVLRVLLDVDQTETISDTLSEKFGGVNGFRIMLLAVEATLPQPEIDEEDSKEEEAEGPGRVSREELYSDVTEGSELTRIYLAMVVLSTLVAGVGLVIDDVATIIGAMVIAPLLAPNVSMALAVTLGDVLAGLAVTENQCSRSVCFPWCCFCHGYDTDRGCGVGAADKPDHGEPGTYCYSLGRR